MKSVIERLREKNWSVVTDELNREGNALVPFVLTWQECNALIGAYSETSQYRKTVSMERYRFGAGEYKYFRYPLPALIDDIRETVYGYLAPVANVWMKSLNLAQHYPPSHDVLKKHCHDHGQIQPTVLILRYGEGGFNTLHQDLYGDIYFPLQAVLFLNEPGEDYTGGEFILTEQIPRAQSRVQVLQPRRGDMLLFTTNFRPVKGSKGYYRVNMKHGVSTVRSGQRHTLGIIFHDALS